MKMGKADLRKGAMVCEDSGTRKGIVDYCTIIRYTHGHDEETIDAVY